MNWNHLKQEMVAHAQSNSSYESCGLIAGGRFHPCTNVHSQPENHFAIDASDYARLEQLGIEGVFHSHIGFNARFSTHDIRSCKQLGIPWVMYCVGGNSWHEMDPTGNAPYLERPWIYGLYDCYGLVRDYYRREFDVVLDDYERGEEFEWTSPEWRMFERNFREQGFDEVDRRCIQRGDVLLMQLQANYPNHVGIIHQPEANVFYQHLLNRLSEACVYGGYWQKCTTKVLRHRSMM